MAGRSSGVHRLAASMAMQNGGDFKAAYNEVATGDHADGQGDVKHADLTLPMILFWDGNLIELLDETELRELGASVRREFELDEAGRKDWLDMAKDALEAAAQKKPEKKSTPFDGSANVKYPILTTAILQFAARAYPAIVRGDEVVSAEVLGDDPDGQKAKRAERSSTYANDQLIYQCTEWEPGTDALLHALPCIGAGFRKVYWDNSLKRPRLDFVPAIDVVIPQDAPSLELSPRITHIFTKYPYEIELKTKGDNPEWGKCDYLSDTSDTQKKVEFLEQLRYADLDKDGLSEPYFVTVHRDTGTVVRIDPAFDEEDVVQNEQGEITNIKRVNCWIDYTFLPDPKGSPYGMGFGQLLQSISATIDTTVNELIDAGAWANSNTGFIAGGMGAGNFKTRGGDIDVRINSFRMLPGVTDIRGSVQRLDFPGPSQTLFNLLEFLIDAAKDITSVKDVLTGETNHQQPATSTLALIEQGLQVFTAIYKRIYRSMTREFEMLYRLNARYLDPADYQKFLDSQPPQMTLGAPAADGQNPGIGHNGGPPLDDQGAGPAGLLPPGAQPQGQVIQFPGSPSPGPGSAAEPAAAGQALQGQGPPPQLPMGAPDAGQNPGNALVPAGAQGAPGLPQALAGAMPQQAAQYTPQQDFSSEDMDIRPVADPTAVTEMQRLAKANFLMQFMNDPACNGIEIRKRVFEAARLADIDKLVAEQNPMLIQQAQTQAAMAQAEILDKQMSARLMDAQSQLALAQAGAVNPEMGQLDLSLKQQQVAQGQAEIELKQRDAARADTELQHRMALDQHNAAVTEAKSGLELEHKDKSDLRTHAIARLQLQTDMKKHADELDQRQKDREHEKQVAELNAEHSSDLEEKKASLAKGTLSAKNKAAEDTKTKQQTERMSKINDDIKDLQTQLRELPKQSNEQNKEIKVLLTQLAKAVEKSLKPKELVRDPKTGRAVGIKISGD